MVFGGKELKGDGEGGIGIFLREMEIQGFWRAKHYFEGIFQIPTIF